MDGGAGASPRFHLSHVHREWDLQTGQSGLQEGCFPILRNQTQPTVDPGPSSRAVVFNDWHGFTLPPPFISSAHSEPAAVWVSDKCRAVCYQGRRLEGNERVSEEGVVFLLPPHTCKKQAVFFSQQTHTLLAFLSDANYPLCYKLHPTVRHPEPVQGVASAADEFAGQVRGAMPFIHLACLRALIATSLD